MSIVLKAEYNGEIRRVGLNKDEDATVVKLEKKLLGLFPHLPQPFLVNVADQVLRSDEDVALAFAKAAEKRPPLVRVSISPYVAPEPQLVASVTAETATADYVQIPSPAEEKFADWTTIAHADTSLGHKCRLCESSLEGVHFKCLNCLDFEVCPRCEDAQLHDASHLFVKMRCHVDNLPLKRQLIFKSHIDNPSDREIAKEEKKKLREKKIELMNRKKEAREAERKKRAQEKLKRLQARKEKVSGNKKAKLTAAEKKVTAISKVKRAKKVVAASAPVEEPLPAEPATVVEDLLSVSATETTPVEEPKQEKADFSIYRLLSEFQLVRTPAVEGSEPKEAPAQEEKVEIELQEIHEAQNEELPAQQPALEEQEEVKAEKEETQFAKNLRILEEMGFTDKEKNVALLVRNVGNLDETIHQLLNPQPFALLTKWLPFSIGI